LRRGFKLPLSCGIHGWLQKLRRTANWADIRYIAMPVHRCAQKYCPLGILSRGFFRVGSSDRPGRLYDLAYSAFVPCRLELGRRLSHDGANVSDLHGVRYVVTLFDTS